ncbi:MAG: Crp/Fnr family transcriptional regulator [Bacteroidota bacterium]|nr:Crp/Fnr family transcriptional regulator [Bacteroidota bacterium]
MIRLANYIRSLIDINDADLRVILSNFSKKKLKKGTFILKHGQVASSYYFIASGAIRIFSGDEPKDKTLWIAFENEFIAELPSIKFLTPSSFSFQAIEETTLITIESGKMDRLYEEFPQFQAFGRQIWEKAFLKVVDNVTLLQTENATERYKKAVLKTDYIQRVSLKYLSSYLGITQTSLSRLRKKIK